MSFKALQPFKSVRFKCPKCDESADLHMQGAVCANCNILFPIRNGSLDFMGPYSLAPFRDEDIAETSKLVLRVLALPDEATRAVEEAVFASYDRTGIPYIDAEIAALPSRFGGNFIGDVTNDDKNQIDGQDDVVFIGHYMPKTFPRGSRVFRSVRIRAGRELAHLGQGRVGLSYKWEKMDRGFSIHSLIRSWRNVDTVTWLPVKVTAGREITISMSMQTPKERGAYTLTIFPVGANTSNSIIVNVEIVDEVKGIPVNRGYGDYGKDHMAAIEFFEAILHDRNSQMILEVASGVNPHLLPLAASDHTVIAGDVCSNQMQLGSIFTHYHHTETVKENLGFASFDAFNPPFQPQQFDGVAMFAALHHFPDPVAFLARLSTLVKPSGFIAVLCEPCDPAAAGEAYIRDLSAGINEQVFSVEEYRQIFALAGLREHSLRNDDGSFKAILLT